MNVRKPTDYSALFAALDGVMAEDLPQMALYSEIGYLISGRPEKGAAVAAAEYLKRSYPDASGFSPRNLRRMRDFYRTYENAPKVVAETMNIGWTQNVVIMEAELTFQEKAWYIRAVQKFGWSKLKLIEQIAASAHKEISLDLPEEVCYTEENNITGRVYDDEHPLYLPQQYLSPPNNRVRNEGLGEEDLTGCAIPHQVCRHQYQRDWKSGLSPGPPEVDHTWNRLCRKSSITIHQCRLQQVRPSDRDEPS